VGATLRSQLGFVTGSLNLTAIRSEGLNVRGAENLFRRVTYRVLGIVFIPVSVFPPSPVHALDLRLVGKLPFFPFQCRCDRSPVIKYVKSGGNWVYCILVCRNLKSSVLLHNQL
jgi:hypothetical protein